MGEYKAIKKIKATNPGSPPDIDSDIAPEFRADVVSYLQNTYGRDSVASIGTRGKMKAKGAFKDVCRIYRVPQETASRATDLIPDDLKVTLKAIVDPESEFYAPGAEFREFVKNNNLESILESAIKFEGRMRSTSIHACGLIVSSKKIADYAPLKEQETSKKTFETVTQWQYPELESRGFIKVDLLSLDSVSLIMGTIERIIASGKTPPCMPEINAGEMDDPKVYEMFSKGETVGVFQFSSDMIIKLLKDAKPTKFSDLPAITSLGRPGPMGMDSHNSYARRKNGLEPNNPIHPEFAGTVVDEILGETYNVIVYQEQVMMIAKEVAGFSLTEADYLRKAMGKKKADLMESMRSKFFEGALANGFSNEAISVLWDTIAKFAEYGFNKCLHGRTLVATADGKRSIESLYKDFTEAPAEKDFYILSMWEDGTIKPHRVKNIVKTGRKPLWTVRTKSGKAIRITKEHRLLTTSGYGSIEDGAIRCGAELIYDGSWSSRLSEETRNKRSKAMTALNKTDESRMRSSARMSSYQATLTHEDRVAHQQKIQKEKPWRTDKGIKACHSTLRKLELDKEWLKMRFMKSVEAKEKAIADGRKYWGRGVPTQLSDGRWCDSIAEASAGEYLISRGVDFVLHKEIENPVSGAVKVTDFYANGIYFEMDGLNRGREYFVKHKYGSDIPFVYMTPLDYKDKIDEAIIRHGVSNGDPIVSIEAPRIGVTGAEYTEMSYDIEMEDDGPSNFIANGIVSHNSHAVAYAMVSYQCAYLKAHYPKEFMSAVISQSIHKKDKVYELLKECRRMKLDVKHVDINTSDVEMYPDITGKTESIFYGLSSIASVKKHTAEIIVAERKENGLYKSVEDVIERCLKRNPSMNKTIFENLAMAGAFDSLNPNRRAIVESLPKILDSLKKQSKAREIKGESLFDMMNFESPVEDSSTVVDSTIKDYSFLERLRLENEVAGIMFSANPMDNLGKSFRRRATLSSLRGGYGGSVGEVLVFVSKKDGLKKSGRKFIEVSDGTDFAEVTLSKDLVERWVKAEAKKDVKAKLGRGEPVAKAMFDKILKPIVELPEIELCSIYRAKLKKTSFKGNSRYTLLDLKPVYVAYDGSIPMRVRINRPTVLGKGKPGALLSYAKDFEDSPRTIRVSDIPSESQSAFADYESGEWEDVYATFYYGNGLVVLPFFRDAVYAQAEANNNSGNYFFPSVSDVTPEAVKKHSYIMDSTNDKARVEEFYDSLVYVPLEKNGELFKVDSINDFEMFLNSNGFDPTFWDRGKSDYGDLL